MPILRLLGVKHSTQSRSSRTSMAFRSSSLRTIAAFRWLFVESHDRPRRLVLDAVGGDVRLVPVGDWQQGIVLASRPPR